MSRGRGLSVVIYLRLSQLGQSEHRSSRTFQQTAKTRKQTSSRPEDRLLRRGRQRHEQGRFSALAARKSNQPGVQAMQPKRRQQTWHPVQPSDPAPSNQLELSAES